MQGEILHILPLMVIKPLLDSPLWTMNQNKSYSYIWHINDAKYQTSSALKCKHA